METTPFLRLRELFDRAICLPANEQRAFLQKECGEDTEMLAQALDLCEAHLAAASRLEPSPESDDTNRVIGPYRLRRQLGEGGMGTVFLAIRDDGTFRKSVAIKILRRDQASAALVERFQQERQVLANLDHINIARILDGGQTPDGLPYYAMEYVEGLPLDKFCDQRKLDLEGRVKIFLQVCDAVDCLHEHLVVHRDLKPSNILVTGDGLVKLLDFGIARQQIAAANAELTAVQGRMMTPGYASPEQLLGSPVTKASDIYTLGVILYELLTGSLPHSDPGEKLTSEPSTPSSRIRSDIQRTTETNAQLRRRIVGDLDQVVLMSLRRDPRHRYGSARDLARDLRSFLESRPVVARKGSLGERAIRFVKRNRIAVAAITLIFLLAGFGAWQAVEAQIQTHRATIREADFAQLLASYERLGTAIPASSLAENVRKLRAAMQTTLGTGGLTPQRNALLQRGVNYLDRVKPVAARDPSLAGEVAGAYKQAALIYQGANPNRALNAYSNAAIILNAAFGGEVEASPYGSDWRFVATRIQILGGAVPGAEPAHSVASVEPAVRIQRSSPATSFQLTPPAPSVAPQAEPVAAAVSPEPPPEMPEDLTNLMDTVSAKASAAEAAFNQMSASAQNVGQSVSPDIAYNYNHMKLSLESAQRAVQAGKFDSAQESLGIAEEFARRVMKQVGR